MPASNIRMPDTFTETFYSEVLKENDIKSPMFNIRKIRQAFFKGIERKAVVIPEELSVDYSDDEIYTGREKLVLRFFCPEEAMAQCSSKGYSSNQSLKQTKEHKVVVIALGGNALIREGQQGTIAEQFENVRKSLDGIIYCLKQGYGVVITHGNGPQVGNMLLMVEASRNQVPELSLGVCVADTEGAIGYMIQQSLTNRLRKRGHQ